MLMPVTAGRSGNGPSEARRSLVAGSDQPLRRFLFAVQSSTQMPPSRTLEAAFEALETSSTRPTAYPILLELLTKDAPALVNSLYSRLQQLESSTTAFRALSAMFELDGAQASKLVQDSRDLHQSLIDAARDLLELPKDTRTSVHQERLLVFANLLNSAASHSAARQLLSSLNAEHWLQASATAKDIDNSSNDLRIVCTTTLAKLIIADSSSKSENRAHLSNLTLRLRDALGASSTIHPTTLEGLAILTIFPFSRRILLTDRATVNRLCSSHTLDTPPPSTPGDKTSQTSKIQLQFSLACIYANLTSYKPMASSDEAAQLQRLVSQTSQSTDSTDWETDEEMHTRCQDLVSSGIIDVCDTLVRSSSLTARRKTGVALANLTRVPQQQFRGILLQKGSATMLLNLARQEPTNQPQSTERPHPDFFTAVQGLARLLITANPALALTPTLQVEATTLLALLFSSPEGTLLQTFEATMALTNLCSLSESLRTHFVTSKTEHMPQLDSVMLFDGESSNGHLLCRRAATQLACNLTMSEAGFAHFAGTSDLSQNNISMPDPKCQNRLHLLLALCDVEDLDTRMAASAALAMLTVSLQVCAYLLQSEQTKQRSLDILASLLRDQSSPGLRQRALACVSNIIQRLSLFPQDLQSAISRCGWKNALSSLSGGEAADARPLLLRLSQTS